MLLDQLKKRNVIVGCGFDYLSADIFQQTTKFWIAGQMGAHDEVVGKMPRVIVGPRFSASKRATDEDRVLGGVAMKQHTERAQDNCRERGFLFRTEVANGILQILRHTHRT